MTHSHSLTRRLLVLVTVALVAFFGISVFMLDSLFRSLADRSLGELLDAQMLALIAAAEPDQAGGIGSGAANFEVRLQTPGSGLYAEIRQRNGRALWRSPSMAGTFLEFKSNVQPGERRLNFVPGKQGERLAAAQRGISWDRAGLIPHQLVFTVASSMAAYDSQLQRFRRQLIGGFLMIGFLLVTLLALLLRWVMSPLDRLAREIGAVEAGRSAVLSGGYPREIEGVANNLNILLEGERRRIARYRDTLGNLAHSLKTPLAVIRASLGGVGERAVAIESEVRRMSGIIEHQLKRAATSGGQAIVRTTVDVLPVCLELKPALSKVHSSKDLLIEIAMSPNLQFIGDRDDLLEVIGNLLDNACKWSRSRVRICAQVNAQPVARNLHVIVEDDGPGIADEQRERVLARGARADENVPGHGLGLAMVYDTVKAYGGALQIGRSTFGGARIELQLPGRVASEFMADRDRT